MKLPSLLHHVFNSDSRKVGFGWWVFIVSTYGAFFARLSDSRPLLEASDWLMCVALASGLIGGGTVADAWISKVKPTSPEVPK
jgi:hypothetical protein